MTALPVPALRVVVRQPKVRVIPVVLFATAAAVAIAWALRENARFLPRSVVPLHNLLSNGHGSSGYVEPAPVTGSAVVNVAGLIFLAIHLTGFAVLAVAWVVRRYFRDADSVTALIVFALLVGFVAALITLPIAAVTVGTAILFTATLTAAMTVFQYCFVLAVVGAAVIGVP